MTYNLIYHAGIPGRAEFVRLFFEATATPYVDSAREVGQSCITPYLKKGFKGCPENPTPFAPPILVHGDVVISQTPNILLYLAARLPPVDLDAPVATAEAGAEPATKKAKVALPTLEDASTFHQNELALSILDLVNEVHDTHHPIDVGAYYEDQKDAAILRAKAFRDARLPKYLHYFEENIKKVDSGFLTKEGPTYADLALFQVLDGIKFAFPRLMAKLLPQYPLTTKVYEAVSNSPRIASYLKSERRQPYSLGIFRHYEELDA